MRSAQYKCPSTRSRSLLDGEILQREAKKMICSEITQHCGLAWGQRVWAMVLTGSLARNEATFIQFGDGLKLLGDADCFILFRRGADVPSEAEIASAETKIRENLANNQLNAKVGLSCVASRFFEDLPPLISTFELRNCGEVLGGEAAALSLVPNFSPREIALEDAWRMLCNRMIEQMEFVGELDASTLELSPELHYATVKLFLDMATSYLIFSKHYAPSYRERSRNLSVLAENSSVEAPFPLKEFSMRVAQCTNWKLTGEDEDCDRSIELWRKGIRYLHQLWRWEAAQVLRTSPEISDAELWRRLAGQLTIHQKLRGWASVAKRSGVLKSCRDWPRWLKLSTRATPRYWIYRAGSEITFRLPDLIASRANETKSTLDYPQMASTLPLCNLDLRQGDEAWIPLAREIVTNYWKYLAGTRT